jgi:D-alanyl-D-alanine carboxypeptidase
MADADGREAVRLDLERCRRWACERGLPPQAEARDLVTIGEDSLGRPLRMTTECAARWHELQQAAAADGVALLVVSAFRSVEHQQGIFERKLARGAALEDILCVNAAPGYSEHHSGRALDLGTPGCVDLSESFEATPAFAWLRDHAARHGFRLSYPRDNDFGIIYEPWHWALCPEP